MAKLLHILGSAALGGNERLCELFIRNTAGIESSVAVLHGGGPAVGCLRETGAEVRCLELNGGRRAWYRAVRQAVAESQAEAVLSWTNARGGLLGAACRGAGIRRVVVRVGNPVALDVRNRVAAGAYGLLPGGRQATLIAVSEHVAASIRRERVFAGADVRVIYNGVDLRRFPFAPKAAPGGGWVAGMVGRLDPIKDQATLLRAWPLVGRRCPGARLELAGEGKLRGELEALAAELGIAGEVRFLGPVTDVAALLRRWDVAVFSTTASEGFGVAMIEAMAAGTPLVATDVGPVREVTEQGRAALLVGERQPEALAAAVAAVIEDASGTAERVARARQLAERRFSAAAMVGEYLKCLGM